MKNITLEYYDKGKFDFVVEEYSEIYFVGKFDQKDINRIRDIDEIVDTENEFWYLDNDGYRLEDKELFKETPWAIIENNSLIKIVMRFMNYESGEARFCLQPWFRIGDEFNHNPKYKS